MNAESILVPARLEPTGKTGWTVYRFDDLSSAHAWAAVNQNAQMACWKRPECWGGKRLGQ